MGKKSGSGMNDPDHISESLNTYILWCGSGIRDGKSRIRDKHPGSATLHTPLKQFWPFLFKRIEDVEEVTAVHAEAEDEELAATHFHNRATMRTHLTENSFIDWMWRSKWL
jgi:hypothetical protein